MVLLTAGPEDEDSYTRRWSASLTGSAVFPIDWLPLELAVGAVVGLALANVSDVGNVPGLTAQIRTTLGYRIAASFTAGLIVSGNAVLLPVGPFWAELGARLALRW